MDSNETQTDDGVTDVENIASDNVNNNNNNDANNNDDDTNIDGKGVSEDFFEKKDIRSKAYIGVPITLLGTEMINVLATQTVPFNFLIYVQQASSADLLNLMSVTQLVSSLAFLYGIIIDVFPICGLSWKSYSILGNIMMCSVMIVIAAYGDGIGTQTYIGLTAAMALGIETTFTAIQGYIPFVAKRERPENKGYFQSVMMQAKTVGGFLTQFVVLIGFSGPVYNCIGYEKDPSVPCSTEQHVLNQNPLSQDNPDNWCHECPKAWFPVNATLREIYVFLVGIVILLTLPSIVFLKEGEKVRGHFQSKIKDIWVALTKRSLWQIILFALVFVISMDVENPSEQLFYKALLHVTPIDITIVGFISTLIAIIFLYLYMRFGLKVSRRKILLGIILLSIICDLLTLVPVYNVTRSKAIYYIIELPIELFNAIPMVVILNAVNGSAEPGQETTVHSLILSCKHIGGAVASGVIAKSLLGLFPPIADAGLISEDTPKMRNDFAKFTIITVCFKFLTIYSLPMLPRQEKETRAIYEKKEQSIVWATVTVVSFIVAFLYISVVIFVPIHNLPFLYTVLAIALIWCISIPACVIYWPIFAKKKKFDWKIFI